MPPSPLIILNFKTYPTSTGENALRLLRAVEQTAAENTAFRFIIAPSFSDIEKAVLVCSFAAVFSQHVDALQQGQSTGWFPASLAKQLRCRGSIINHSEHPLTASEIAKIVSLCKKLHLQSLVCVPSVQQATRISKLKPDMIAFEPPELIRTGVSVSTARISSVKKFLALRKYFKGKLLIGAGISGKSDLRKSLELGADGVLVASAFAKAKSPGKWLEHFVV